MTTSPLSDRDAVAPRPGRGGQRIGELMFAGAVLALGILAFVGAFWIRTPAGAAVGPRVFPFLVAAVLVGAGTVLVVQVLRGRLGTAEEGEDIDSSAGTDWWTILKLIALVAGVVLLLEPLGWWLVSALLFGGAAWSLGARTWWLAFLVGLVLGVGTQLLFGEGLGLFLPRGWLFDAWYGPGPLFG